jgi:hypothetical protein
MSERVSAIASAAIALRSSMSASIWARFCLGAISLLASISRMSLLMPPIRCSAALRIECSVISASVGSFAPRVGPSGFSSDALNDAILRSSSFTRS